MGGKKKANKEGEGVSDSGVLRKMCVEYLYGFSSTRRKKLKDLTIQIFHFI